MTTTILLTIANHDHTLIMHFNDYWKSWTCCSRYATSLVLCRIATGLLNVCCMVSVHVQSKATVVNISREAISHCSGKGEVGRSAVNLRELIHISMLSPTNLSRVWMVGHCGVLITLKFYFPTHRESCWIKSPPSRGASKDECGDLTHSPFCRTNMWNLSHTCSVQNLHPWSWSRVYNYYQPLHSCPGEG